MFVLKPSMIRLQRECKICMSVDGRTEDAKEIVAWCRPSQAVQREGLRIMVLDGSEATCVLAATWESL